MSEVTSEQIIVSIPGRDLLQMAIIKLLMEGVSYADLGKITAVISHNTYFKMGEVSK